MSDLPKVFLDIKADDDEFGRLLLELRSDVVPKTAENFQALCTHEKGYGYKGSIFHRIIPGFMCQGGDITNFDGTGGMSIFDDVRFDDENFEIKHDEPGILSMANCGPDTNGSQFFITTVATPWLDGVNVAFGKLVDGMDTLMMIEKCGSKSGAPTKLVIVNDCGQLNKDET